MSTPGSGGNLSKKGYLGDPRDDLKLKIDPKLDALYVNFFWCQTSEAPGGCRKSGFWTFEKKIKL